jgi:hypothetical protein
MGSQKFHATPRGLVQPALMLAAVAVFLLCSPERAGAAGVLPPVSYNGSTKATISFGASKNYGASAAPVWLRNNVTGLNDILESPGGSFPTINAAVSNNVASVGPATIGPHTFEFLNWTGGHSGDGSTFGAGSGAIFGPSAIFGLTSSVNGASYGIETWTASYTQNVAYNGTFGTYLSVGGRLDGVGSFVVAAAQTEVTVGAGAGAHTYVLTPLILAVEETAPGTYAYVYDSQSGAKILVNSVTNGFAGLAIDNYAAHFLPGTPISATTTLTFFGDPAMISTTSPDLSLLPGVSLPGESFGAGGVPEPGSLVMGGSAMIALSFLSWLRRRARRAA